MTMFFYYSVVLFLGASLIAQAIARFPIPSVDCQSLPQASYPFCDPKLNPEARATDLVSRLTVDELISQTFYLAPTISRLGINAYNWRSNCAHGWTESGGPDWLGYTWTVFPAPIGMAATFDKDLVLKAGQVTSTEGRALHNEIMTHYNGSSQEATGLNCYSPVVNLLRDSRWGRAQETFGEDPYLLSQIGVAYTKGLQEGSDPTYVKVAASPKHFSVHSGPDNIRNWFTANTTLHDLYDTYLAAFKSQVMGGKAMQIMPALSGMRCEKEEDGAPDAANPFLLQTVLREQFGAPNISVVSDNAAIEQVYSDHHFASSYEQAAALCMNAGTDLDLGDTAYIKYLPVALKDNLVQLETIRRAVWRSFYLRIRVGDFDPVSLVPYQLINGSQINTPDSQALNLKMTAESIVLLKNSGTLPLKIPSIKQKLAVIGPNANASTALLSNYQGIPAFITTVYEGIKSTGVPVGYAPGCPDVTCANKSSFSQALAVAADADFVIAVMGLDGTVEGEGHDRVNTTCDSQPVDNLALPGCQTALVEEIIAINPRVILVLINGGPVSIPTLYANSGVLAILEAFYPGPLGGKGVSDVLFGDYNPGGRLPYTVLHDTTQLPVATDYNMTTPPGRTHRYYTGKPLFPFGYGLSYTTFKYSGLVLSASRITVCSNISVKVSVQNVGDVVGDDVIQVYLEPPRLSGKPFIPNIQLVGFERVSNLPVAGNYTGSFEVNAYLLSLVDRDGEHYVFPGSYIVVVTDGAGNRLTAPFVIEGSVTNVKECPGAPSCLAC
jgi:beta-glucosidase